MPLDNFLLRNKRIMTKKAAATITTAILLATNLAAMALTDFSFVKGKSKKTYSTAAIAVRDDVVTWQKTATKLFTKPYLKKLYEDFIYLEEKNITSQEEKFVYGLTQLLISHDSVDVYLLAHGNSMIEWVQRIESNLTKKIRLVYNCGCDNARQNAGWKSLGVKYYLAHKGGKSLSPVFYYFFIRRRVDGRSLEKSITAANRHTRLLLACIGFSKSKAGESCATLYPF